MRARGMSTRAARAARGVPPDEDAEATETTAGSGIASPALIALGMGTLTMTVLWGMDRAVLRDGRDDVVELERPELSVETAEVAAGPGVLAAVTAPASEAGSEAPLEATAEDRADAAAAIVEGDAPDMTTEMKVDRAGASTTGTYAPSSTMTVCPSTVMFSWFVFVTDCSKRMKPAPPGAAMSEREAPGRAALFTGAFSSTDMYVPSHAMRALMKTEVKPEAAANEARIVRPTPELTLSTASLAARGDPDAQSAGEERENGTRSAETTIGDALSGRDELVPDAVEEAVDKAEALAAPVPVEVIVAPGRAAVAVPVAVEEAVDKAEAVDAAVEEEVAVARAVVLDVGVVMVGATGTGWSHTRPSCGIPGDRS